ncbi:hypothetical protein CLV97_13426 [Planifilum fimeticola]|uniref:Uncharacterized protein n=1 Tax=Planifilum fimeticola TaxID=201975 RepID=A0A2T0LAP1_9BACL|nr:hypothetical protein [Planifilum fimeticola]PRX38884.1 hypothetical protein CLV97_13426 [Planifilum fimeticola]
MTLFDECIEALKSEGEVIVLSEEETNEVINEFEKSVPSDPLVAKVDFTQISRKKEIEDDEDILEELYKNNVNVNEPVYVFWNDADLPAIQTFIKNVINVIEDVISVSFDTYIFCPKERYFVEYYHEGETFLGFY